MAVHEVVPRRAYHGSLTWGFTAPPSQEGVVAV